MMMRILIKCLCSILICYPILAETPEELFSFISPKEIALLKNFIQMEDFHNITLIGSENIYNENGELIEIRTLELHWPQNAENQYTSLISERDDEKERNVSIETISIKELTALYATTSSDIEYDNNGKVTEETLVANNLKVITTADIKLMKKSIALESVDLVDQAIKELETGVDGKLSVLRYDEQGRFISDGSHIAPEYLASITNDEGETSPYLFDEIMKGFATAYVEYQGDERVIPGKFAKYLEETFSNQEFYVFSGLPTGWYLPEKGFFKVVVQFDGIWDTDPVKYTVFGTKKMLM